MKPWLNTSSRSPRMRRDLGRPSQRDLEAAAGLAQRTGAEGGPGRDARSRAVSGGAIVPASSVHACQQSGGAAPVPVARPVRQLLPERGRRRRPGRASTPRSTATAAAGTAVGAGQHGRQRRRRHGGRRALRAARRPGRQAGVPRHPRRGRRDPRRRPARCGPSATARPGRRRAPRAHGGPGARPRSPRLAVVSRPLDLDPAASLFTEADGAADRASPRDGADPSRRAALAEVADVVDGRRRAGSTWPRRSRAAAPTAGSRSCSCEGGPSLNGQLVAAGLVDELCLTRRAAGSSAAARRGSRRAHDGRARSRCDSRTCSRRTASSSSATCAPDACAASAAGDPVDSVRASGRWTW